MLRIQFKYVASGDGKQAHADLPFGDNIRIVRGLTLTWIIDTYVEHHDEYMVDPKSIVIRDVEKELMDPIIRGHALSVDTKELTPGDPRLPVVKR